MAAPATRNLTILLTDIKGFTDKTSHKSRTEIQQLLDEHRAVVLPILESKGGRLIKTIGDAFLMVFDSPTDAVLAGVAVQDALLQFNAGRTPENRIEIRIAINTGEVNLADNDIFGEPVNITARIEGVAEANEVFFTEAVYLAMNKKEVPSSEVGLLQLKGIPEKIRVYKVKRERPVEGMAEPASAPESRGLWGALKARPAAAPAGSPPPKAAFAGSSGKPSVLRRAAALAIDALLCSVLLGFFHPKESGRVRVTVKSGPASRATVSPASPSVQAGEDGVKIENKQGSFSLDDRGIRITQAPGAPGAKGGSSVEIEGDPVGKTFHAGRVFALIWLIYGWLFVKKLGATPGQRIMKLAVVSQDGSPVQRKQALWRAAFSVVSGAALMLGYLWALWEKDGRTWHDLVAGTRVVPAA